MTYPILTSDNIAPAPDPPRAVAIGASTGGPSALLEILRALPDNVDLPIFVAQHMPQEFVPEFVKNIIREVTVKAVLGAQNEIISNGYVYVAPGDHDMKIVIDGIDRKRLLLADPFTMLKPSIDILMASAATAYGSGCLGIILTGMGVDGLEGMRAIKAVGGKTIIQDEATSAVYGMARTVSEEHLADEVLPLSAIAQAIIAWSTAR